MVEIKNRILELKENKCESCNSADSMILNGTYKHADAEGFSEANLFVCKFCFNKQTFFVKNGKRVTELKFY
ncbi:MAG: hypothetical protein AABW89_05860 [Nanoarchaeota archaeon]